MGEERLYELGQVFDQKIWAADIQEHVVARDGATYTTQCAHYDAYGNPSNSRDRPEEGGPPTTSVFL
ncbi:hypothetical protein HX882_23115 [Pseudomonas gingeri]|uniref:YD repeat-containing protein n=1 Tax=Pseudomonas gingeri TaxID=117681 RepID=A0A7Y7XFK2_9PSED|nr:hypothetical protein [Pseudomonas gingeri]NWB98786.1 hypothetical protein [Pseudomonas gingeri]